MSLALKRSVQPIISCRIESTNLLVFSLSAPHRFGVEPFLAEMVSSHLLPGVRLQLERFRLSCCDGYLEGDIAILLHSSQVEKVRRCLDLFTHELGLGVASSFYASQLLEMGGSDKRALVNEHLSRLIHRFPTHFDYDLLTIAQHLFLSFSETFCVERSVRHLARIATSLYAVDAHVASGLVAAPSLRHVFVKIGRGTLVEPLSRRPITTIAAAINTLHEHELVTEKHLKEAVQALAPDATFVKESFRHDSPADGVHLFYVEVEHVFSLDGLQDEFAKRVEHLMPPLVMPRNEEEVMRGLLTLSQQLKYVRDIPQAIISFDRQDTESVTFTVILARLAIGEMISMEKLFEATSFIVETYRSLGRLRQKYEKEGAVLSLSLPSKPYKHADGSIDLLFAREDVAARLSSIIGEFRDYNGGMLAKESERFEAFMGMLEPHEKIRGKKLFSSIEPSHMRATVDKEFLREILRSQSNRVVYSKNEDAVFEGELDGVRFWALERFS